MISGKWYGDTSSCDS